MKYNVFQFTRAGEFRAVLSIRGKAEFSKATAIKWAKHENAASDGYIYRAVDDSVTPHDAARMVRAQVGARNNPRRKARFPVHSAGSSARAQRAEVLRARRRLLKKYAGTPRVKTLRARFKAADRG